MVGEKAKRFQLFELCRIYCIQIFGDVTHQSFIIFLGVWVDTDHHPHLAFSIKIILEQMCEARVAIWNQLKNQTFNITDLRRSEGDWPESTA